MRSGAYYNECDTFAARWLSRLVSGGHIAPGTVDARRIESLKPGDLDGFAQVHLFAGIGAWSYALRLAGWADDRPVWTLSCPCQPFSDAGSRAGLGDDRHLWPVAFDLIRECRPYAVFGEQVSSKDGLAWFDSVSSDLEGAGYTVGAIDTCAASVGAPHRRQRLFFVGYADGGAARKHDRELSRDEGQHGQRSADRGDGAESSSGTVRVADDHQAGRFLERASRLHGEGERGDDTPRRREGGEWDDPDWVLCDDPGGSRWRPVESGTFPLVDGSADRLGRLRGYGNAIVPRVAAEFIGAALDLEAAHA